MPARNDHQRAVINDLLNKFPTAHTKTLAQKAYTENVGLWPNEEACRYAFRRARGNAGKQNRRYTGGKTHYRTNRKPGDPFAKLPPGMKEMEGWASAVINEPGRYLVIADLHVPYHDDEALQLILESHPDVTGLILLGDLMDCFAMSPWETDPRKRKFGHEISRGRRLMAFLREFYPKAHIVYKLGNHDERLERYLSVKAPELLDVPTFRLRMLLRCKKHNIDVVEDRRRIQLGKMNLIHGHEYRFQISNPVNPARGLFLRAKTLATCAHFHQTSQHSGKSLDDKVTSCWSIGCCCDLHPYYRPYNEWNLGFATIDIDEGGAFHVQNYRILDGKIWT